MQVERDDQGFPTCGVKRDIRCIGHALRAISVYARVTAGREQRVFEAVAERGDSRAVRLQIFSREVRGFSETNDAWDIFRAGAAIAFVMATVELRFEGRAGANVERTDALRAVYFVRGNGEQVHAETIYIERQLSGGLHGVAMEQDVCSGGDTANLFDGLNGAELVVGMHDADQNCFWLKRPADVFWIYDSFAAYGDEGDFRRQTFPKLARR